MSKPKIPQPEHKHYYTDLGINIKYFRYKAQMTQRELSDLVGITVKYLSLIESSTFDNPPSLEILFSISDSLGITPGQLLDGPSKYLHENQQ